MANLAGKTYEVQYQKDNHWTMEATHESRTPAIEQAKTMAEKGKYQAVRVISDSERSGTVVEFEQAGQGTDRPIRVKPVEDAPMCKETKDFYGFEARLTLSRLMREYLDELTLSPLQLLFNPSQLMRLESFGELLPQAIGRVASVQSRKYKIPAHERTDFLFETFKDIKKTATGFAAPDQQNPVESGGLDAFLKTLNVSESDLTNTRVLAMISDFLDRRADWSDKTEGLTDQILLSKSPLALSYLETAVAEILDAPEAVRAVLGGQADLAAQLIMLCRLAGGHMEADKIKNAALEKINTVTRTRSVPNIRHVLLSRVAQLLGGTYALTRSDIAGDQQAFATLVRELTVSTGMAGGEVTTEALIRRARVLYRTPDADLPVAKAAMKILSLIPGHWARVGFLLDLQTGSFSDQAKSETATLLDSLIKRDVPANTAVDAQQLEQIRDVLTKRCQQSPLTEPLKSNVLDHLRMSSETPAPQPAPPAGKPQTDKKQLQPGKILFREGDEGSEAFLILSGCIEVYKIIDGKQISLAKLGRGDILGEMSLIDKQPRMASARATEPTELTVISEASLGARLERLNQTDRVLRRLLDVMAARLRGQVRIGE